MNDEQAVALAAAALREDWVGSGIGDFSDSMNLVAEEVAGTVVKAIAGQVRADALREAAAKIDTTDNSVEAALQGLDFTVNWLLDQADAVSRGGAS